MDPFTLVVATALVGASMALGMGLLYHAGARQRCLFDWALAGLFFAANNVLSALMIAFPTEQFLVPGAGNVFYVAGHFGILAGLRRHLGLPPRWEAMGVLALAILGAHLLAPVQSSLTHRVLLFTPIIAGINFSAARLLWRQPDREARRAGMPMILLETCFLVQQTVRAGYLLAGEGGSMTPAVSRFLQISGSLAVLVFLSVAMLSCVMIVHQQQARALRLASLTDMLTGCLNRRALHEAAARTFARCRRDGAPLAFITFDIDHFKSINDRHGHAVGDSAIRHVAMLSDGVLRGCGALFRIGGEEFAVPVAGARAHQAGAVAERLRALVAATPLDVGGRHEVRMTVSVGVAALLPGDAGWEDILRRADEALYHAKQHGRNRVSVHGVDVQATPPASRRAAGA